MITQTGNIEAHVELISGEFTIGHTNIIAVLYNRGKRL